MIDWASYVRSTYNGVSVQMPIQFPSNKYHRDHPNRRPNRLGTEGRRRAAFLLRVRPELAPNVVGCKTAIRLESAALRTRLPRGKNVACDAKLFGSSAAENFMGGSDTSTCRPPATPRMAYADVAFR